MTLQWTLPCLAMLVCSVGCGAPTGRSDRECGGETAEGRCDGRFVVHCVDDPEGARQVQIDTCDGRCDATGGAARCVDLRRPACAGFDETAVCVNSWRVWCEDGAPRAVDCADDGQLCGLTPEGAASCRQPPPPDEVDTVRGHVRVERQLRLRSGWSDPLKVPARRVTVRLRTRLGTETLARTVTDDHGAFELTWPAGDGPVLLSVRAETRSSAYDLAVEGCPMGLCDWPDAHEIVVARFTPNGEATQEVDALVPLTDPAGGAFTILDVTQLALDRIDEWVGPTGRLVVDWAPGQGSYSEDARSYYSPLSANVVLDDSEHNVFDHFILRHELGHHFRRTLVPGGVGGAPHDGTPMSAPRAWQEGLATWFAAEMAGSPRILERNEDIRTTLYTIAEGVPIETPVSEWVVAQALWLFVHGDEDVAGAGLAPALDVMTQYFHSDRLVDRGVEEPDLVDFLDGWRCRGHGHEALLDRVVAVTGFPYDYAGPDACP